jgi:hypothetical protein
MIIKFNNSDITLPLTNCVMYKDRVELHGEGVKEVAEQYIADLPEDIDNFELFITKNKEELEPQKTENGEPPVPPEPEVETREYPGFQICRENGTVVKDCALFVYRWNIFTEFDDGIVLTSSKTDRETEPNPYAESPKEIIEPLSDGELTECVAELMYQVDCNELGI